MAGAVTVFLVVLVLLTQLDTRASSAISDWEGIHKLPGDWPTQVRTGVNAGIDMSMVPYNTSFIDDVLALAPGSRLNLLLNDGVGIAATTVGHALWVHDAEDSITVSSEPLDPADERWHPVPDLSLVEATAAEYSIHHLEQGRS